MRFRPIQPNKRWLRACAALLLALFVILLLWIDYINYKWREDLAQESEAAASLALLQTQMSYVSLNYEKKEAEVMRLRNHNFSSTGYTISNFEQDDFYKDVIAALDKLHAGSAYVKPVPRPQPLDVELITSTMRHLTRNPRAASPAFQVLSPRRASQLDLVIGVPTVKRDKESYLIDTIQSLIDGMTAFQRTRSLIVVYVGEVDDIQFIAETACVINNTFREYYGQLIEVVSPNRYWYPKWSVIRGSLGDSYKRTVWRTKQNLDAIFLMSYAQNKGTYYLMVEDDIVAKTGYVTHIIKFTASQTVADPNWFFINFSRTGGIGKLFRSQDLAIFNSYVQVFYPFMPIDWLLETYLGGRVCGLNTKSDTCGNLKQIIRPQYKISLFEHVGLYSSLRGKLHKIKHTYRSGKASPMFYPHWNPSVVKITATVKSVDSHTLARAYYGHDYFYGEPPKANDSLTFWFNPPVLLQKLYIGSGHTSRPVNTLQRSVLEVLPEGRATFVYVDKFDEFGVCEAKVDSFGPINAIQIRILSNISHQIIINEINVQPMMESKALPLPKNGDSAASPSSATPTSVS